jgi:hypothetical protein
LKKLTGSVCFSFISLKPKKGNRTQTRKKTKPNRKKPSQNKKTEPNRFEPVFVLKNRTKTGRFEVVSVFLKNKFNLIIFFIKTKPKK